MSVLLPPSTASTRVGEKSRGRNLRLGGRGVQVHGVATTLGIDVIPARLLRGAAHLVARWWVVVVVGGVESIGGVRGTVVRETVSLY